MHEMPIVLNVVRTLDHLVEEKNLPPEIRVVAMEIGELASVMPNYFENAGSLPLSVPSTFRTPS